MRTKLALAAYVSILMAVVLAGPVWGWAQDEPAPGETSGGTVYPPPEMGEIDTGSVAGPILTGPVVTDPPGKYKYVTAKYDLRPLDTVGATVPAQGDSTMVFNRVVGWDLVPTGEVDEASGLPVATKTLGTIPAEMEAAEIYWVEFDCTGEFKEYETTRLYLRSGGYVIAAGSDETLRNRWRQVRRLGQMTARVTRIPQAATDSE